MSSGNMSMRQQFIAVLKLFCISENENDGNVEEGEITNKSREDLSMKLRETDKKTQSSSSQLPLFINPLERSYFIRK